MQQHRFAGRYGQFFCGLLVASVATLSGSIVQAQAPIDPSLFGINVSGIEFVDVMKSARPWEGLEGGTVQLNEQGFPLGDARTVVFDERPCCIFFPEPDNTIDDPLVQQTDISGTYFLSFTGKSVIIALEDPQAFTIENQVYTEPTNTTTAKLVQHSGHQLMVLGFTQTEGGIRDVRLIRPGYPADSDQVFTERSLRLLAPYGVLRFQDWVATQNNAGMDNWYVKDNVLEWSERHVPTDATQQGYGVKYGIAWEYLILLANQLHKDIWITIPQPASEDYVRQLALLLRDGNEFTGGVGLDDELNIYVEDSNEVWNHAFRQWLYNFQAAEAEVAADSASNLNVPEVGDDTNQWAMRRHARRTITIGRIFAEVYGNEATNTKLRPILAWWVLYPEQYGQMLDWLAQTYGNPNDYLYAIAGAPYFSTVDAAPNASVEDLLKVMRKNIDVISESTLALAQVAQTHGLRYVAYEGGPDSSVDGGSTINMANRAAAMRDSRLKDLILYYLQERWYAVNPELFMYYSAFGANIRFGYFGTTDDVNNLYTPQLQAIYELLNMNPPRVGGGLLGTYFNTPDLSDDVRVTRIDQVLDFSWGTYPPAWKKRMNADGFSVRWTGQLEASSTGAVTLSVVSEGGVRLMIDDQVIIDNWNSHTLRTDTSAPLSLREGEFYTLTMEYHDQPGNATVQLLWTLPGQEAQVIPQHSLYPTTARLFELK